MWQNRRMLKDIFFTIALYLAGAFLSSLVIINSNLPFYIWFQTGLMVGIVLTRGIKNIIGVFLGATIWQIILHLAIVPKLSLSIDLSFFLILSEVLTVWLSYKFLHAQQDTIQLIQRVSGIKRFLTTSVLATLPQAIIVALILSFGKNHIEYNIFKLSQLVWLCLITSMVTITPFFISFSNPPKDLGLQKIEISWEFLIFLFTLIAPNLLEITRIATRPYYIPIHYLVYPAVFIIAFRNSTKTLTFSLLLFSLFTFYTTSLQYGIFFSQDPYLNTTNIYYFVLFFSFTLLIISTVVYERKLANESIKNAYIDVEKEVQRKTNEYKELTAKLFEEIVQRRAIERELQQNRNLLMESQNIGGIISWELILESGVFHWSDSAHKIIGCELEDLPKTITELFNIVHPEDVQIMKNLFSNVSERPTDFETEVRHVLFGGRIIFTLIKCRSFEEQGVVKRIVGLSLDITDRKKAENQIAEKEEKYRALFESNIDSVSIINPDDKTFIDVNNAFIERYGYTKEEIVGLPYSIITTEAEESYKAIDTAFLDGSFRMHTRLQKRKNGEKFYSQGTFVRYTSLGKPMIFAMSQDITKRITAEKNLEERELQYRLFFESNLIGMAETSTQKKWITFNNKLCTILGYTPEELNQKTWEEITYPMDLRMEHKLYNDLILRKSDGYVIEKRLIRKDGSTLHCNVAIKAFTNSEGNITHFVMLTEDISDRKQAEKELIASRSTLRRAQQIAHLGSFSWNTTNKNLTINDEAYLILGWDKVNEPFTIDSFISIVLPEKKLIVEKIIEDAIHGLIQADSIEVPIYYKSSDIRYLLFNVGFNIKTSIDVFEIVVTIADITDVKKAEIALQEANAMKDQLFSIIAHDLRGPIGSIYQMMELLEEKINSLDIETRDEILKSLKSLSHDTFNLLENLLEWARNQRQSTFKPKTLFIKSIIADAISLLSGMSSPKRIIVTSSIDDDLIAFADPYMINTVVRNLISNAIKFTPVGGTIRIIGTRADSSIVLKFIDSGIGITPDVTEKLFDSSVTHTTPGTNNEKGTGLGLKLVKRFIDKNGGTITLESTPGIGTTFIITLPIHQP